MQQSFADMEYENRKQVTKRDEFLGTMEEVIPWDEWVSVAAPYYPNAIKQTTPAAKDAAAPEKGKGGNKRKARKWSCDGRIFLQLPAASYMPAQNMGAIWAPLAIFTPPQQTQKIAAHLQKHSVYACLQRFTNWCPVQNHA